jgi:hypothetical protein
VSAFNASNRLILKSCDGNLVGLPHLDEGAVDKGVGPSGVQAKCPRLRSRGQAPPIGANSRRSCSNVPNAKKIHAIDLPPSGDEGLHGVQAQGRVEVLLHSVFSRFSINLVGAI